MKKNILLLLSTLFILILLSEAGARIWSVFRPPRDYPERGAYSYYPYLPYSPTPNYVGLDSFRILNSRGFRNSNEFLTPKPPNTFRVICLGGSTTYDDYDKQQDTETWPGRLQHYLNLNSNSEKYEVINSSAHNYHTYMNLIDYMTRCRDLKPDIVVIYEGINEIYFNGFKNVTFAHTNVFKPFDFNYNNYYYNINHNPLLRYSMFLRMFYIKFFINPLNINVMSTKEMHYYGLENLKNVKTDSLYTFKKGMEGFIGLSIVDGFEIVFLSQAYDFNNFERYFNLSSSDKPNTEARVNILKEESVRTKNMMESTAAVYNVPFLDMNAVMNQNDSLFANPTDAVHFSKRGSDYFGFRVYEFLKEKNLLN